MYAMHEDDYALSPESIVSTALREADVLDDLESDFDLDDAGAWGRAGARYEDAGLRFD